MNSDRFLISFQIGDLNGWLVLRNKRVSHITYYKYKTDLSIYQMNNVKTSMKDWDNAFDKAGSLDLIFQLK